ncbi:efflux RND transporter periplasmic adaptor subunit [candidate division KSB1 bacterium]|nr:efflux RND transporter periplasmic adaptor subunit [candidate division KSB1 bacterium]
MKKNRIGLMVATVIFIAFQAGCSGPDQGAMGGFSMPPTPVEVAPVTSQTVIDKFNAVGTIEAEQSITLVSEIDAAVVSLPFVEGSEIKRGGLIAQLDDSQLAAEVARYEALLAQSRVSYNRIKEIVDQNAGAPQDLDDAAAALQVAEANLALAKARFDKTRIVAPFSGIVGARRVSVGTFLRAGQVIADLARIDEIRVTFSAPERYLSQLSRGASVDVSTTAYPNYALQGKIIVVEPILDAATRNARVVARMQNPGGKFRPGMSANVTAVLSERSNAITIPSEAVFAAGDQSFAFVVGPDSTVAQVPLTLGTRLATVVEVTSGLQPGQQVVRTGHQKIYQGAKVFPITSQPQQGSAAQQEK